MARPTQNNSSDFSCSPRRDDLADHNKPTDNWSDRIYTIQHPLCGRRTPSLTYIPADLSQLQYTAAMYSHYRCRMRMGHPMSEIGDATYHHEMTRTLERLSEVAQISSSVVFPLDLGLIDDQQIFGASQSGLIVKRNGSVGVPQF